MVFDYRIIRPTSFVKERLVITKRLINEREYAKLDQIPYLFSIDKTKILGHEIRTTLAWAEESLEGLVDVAPTKFIFQDNREVALRDNKVRRIEVWYTKDVKEIEVLQMRVMIWDLDKHPYVEVFEPSNVELPIENPDQLKKQDHIDSDMVACN